MTEREKLIEDNDRLFSLLVRQMHSNNGAASCSTHNGGWRDWRKLQCGHFRKRRFMATRWNIHNAAPQCGACNKWGAPGSKNPDEGEPEKMAAWLDRTFGEGTADRMTVESHKTYKPMVPELQAIKEDLLTQLRERGFKTS